MIRSSIARKTSTAKTPAKGPRTLKCKAAGCGRRYVPGDDPRVVWCSDDCAVTLALATVAKRRAAAAKAQRADTAARKEKVKRLSDWIAEAQVAFNAFIRERDQGQQCISCDVHLWSLASVNGGGIDCGHYRSRGSAPHLRFDERNAHGQCKKCNRYLSGNVNEYRWRLIARIGLRAVEELESDQTPRKWNVEELRSIKETYRAKLKQLRASCK